MLILATFPNVFRTISQSVMAEESSPPQRETPAVVPMARLLSGRSWVGAEEVDVARWSQGSCRKRIVSHPFSKVLDSM